MPKSSAAASFQDALEAVEKLPDEQQHDLVEIVRRRQSERRRGQLAANIQQARGELARGEVRRGSVIEIGTHDEV